LVRRPSVSRKITKKRPDIERLYEQDEVWALCVRTPPPGWRLLGRFYRKDVFIALRAWDKRRLAGHYAEASSEVISEWKNRFGDESPLRSEELADYIGFVMRDLDEED